MKKTFISSIMLALVCMICSLSTHAQVLLVEDFDYPIGSTLISNGWTMTGSSTDNPMAETMR